MPESLPAEYIVGATAKRRFENLDSVPKTTYITATGAGTYIPPPSCKCFVVECVGGGGGGQTASSAFGGPGGGGGGYAKKQFLHPFAASYSYSVAASVAADTDGNDTTFSTVTAGGGKKGSSSSGMGGNGGTATGGDFNVQGSDGASG